MTGRQAAEALGWPLQVTRSALKAAVPLVRAREAEPYMHTVLHALADACVEARSDGRVGVRPDGVAVAAVQLGDDAVAPVLLWREDDGWHWAGSRRHPHARLLPDPDSLLPSGPRPPAEAVARAAAHAADR